MIPDLSPDDWMAINTALACASLYGILFADDISTIVICTISLLINGYLMLVYLSRQK